MNVAVLVGRFGVGSGTAGVADTLVRWLVARGHRVQVHTDRVDGPVPDGVTVAPMGARWTAASRVPPGFVRLALDRVPGCEVARMSGGVHAAWVGIRGGRRASDPLELALDRRTARTAGRVICNSSRVAGEVAAFHGIPLDRIVILRTGVDVERFRPDPARRARVRGRLGIAQDARVALFVGHGFRRKGLDTAVAAFAAAARPADRLIVAGTDAHGARWIAPAAARLGSALIVAPPGTIDDWLGAADAAVLPSRYDAASNAALEAMAAGVPPVVSARDGAAETVPDRRLVVGDPRSVQGFADGLRYAWGADGLPRRCRDAALGWPDSRMAERLEEILVETVHG